VVDCHGGGRDLGAEWEHVYIETDTPRLTTIFARTEDVRRVYDELSGEVLWTLDPTRP
jgi:hypothetical protein